MQDSIIGIMVMINISLFCLAFILYQTHKTLISIQKIMLDTLESDYRTIEKNAEIALAEEDLPEFETDAEESLYLMPDGTYSYEAYNDNKKKRDAKLKKDEYIDDFEEAAVKLERINKYDR